MRAKPRPGWERLTRPPESAKRTSPAQDRLWAPSLTCLPSTCEESSRTAPALKMELRASSSDAGREHSELAGATPAQGRASESGTSGRGSSGKAAAREATTREGTTSVVPNTPAADTALAAEVRSSSAAYPSGSVILQRPLWTRWQVLVPAGLVLLGLAIASFLY